MSYYIKPLGRSAMFVLQDTTNKTLRKATGTMACQEPFTLKNPLQRSSPYYSAYEVIIVDGMTEMIEHKKMEPVFYITDDPAPWKQYKTAGC